MGRKILMQKEMESGELVMPFHDRYLKCRQHYYVTSLKDHQWPKVEAFSAWLKEMAQLD